MDCRGKLRAGCVRVGKGGQGRARKGKQAHFSRKPSSASSPSCLRVYPTDPSTHMWCTLHAVPQAFKRLITFVQRAYPTDPSRSVNFQTGSDLGRGIMGGGSDKVREAAMGDSCPAAGGMTACPTRQRGMILFSLSLQSHSASRNQKITLLEDEAAASCGIPFSLSLLTCFIASH